MTLIKAINPIKVPLLFERKDLFLVSLASASLIFTMYAVITPIHQVLNPRYHLQAPWQAGLFYLAPGSGYFVGTLCGGKWADHVVRKWKAKLGGVRRPEDRLRSGVWFLGVGMTVSVQVYSWCVQTNRGGIPLTVIALFIHGFCQLMIFPSLNTFCLGESKNPACLVEDDQCSRANNGDERRVAKPLCRGCGRQLSGPIPFRCSGQCRCTARYHRNWGWTFQSDSYWLHLDKLLRDNACYTQKNLEMVHSMVF